MNVLVTYGDKKMKKIVLFVLMIIASVNLFSNEIPDDISLDYVVARYLYKIVLNDVRYKCFIMKDEHCYESSIHDNTVGYISYQITRDDNSEKEIVRIFHEDKIYIQRISRKEMFTDYFFKVGIIEVFNKEENILYNIRFYTDGDIVFESFFDYRTYEHYTDNRLGGW